MVGTRGLLDGYTLSLDGTVATELKHRVHTMKTEIELQYELIRAREAFPANKMKYIVLDGKALDVCLDGPVLRAKDKTNLGVRKAMDEPIYRECSKYQCCVTLLCAVVCHPSRKRSWYRWSRIILQA